MSPAQDWMQLQWLLPTNKTTAAAIIILSYDAVKQIYMNGPHVGYTALKAKSDLLLIYVFEEAHVV